MFDDVIIPTSGTLSQHLEDVGKVFDKLIQAGFAVRCDKVHLAMKQVMYVGFQVGAEGTQPHPAKTKALLDMTIADMQTDPAAAARYAGMIGYYHKFVPNLHSVLAPFHELKAKGAEAKDVMSTLRFIASFEYTKHQLAEATALARPDYAKPFYIDVDAASSTGAGAVLQQQVDDDDPFSMQPIAWWSRRFTGEERRYGVRDQECLALVDSIEAWRPIVSGGRIIVRTDHHSLEWLLRTLHREGTRVSGFALKMQGYNVEIRYVQGKAHTVADCMSRNIPRDASTDATGAGGEERGAIPDITGSTRAPIEDRVQDAFESAAQASSLTAEKQGVQRVVAVILRQNGSNKEILVERQDDHVALPAVEDVGTLSAATYRSQVALRMQQTYGNDAAMNDALKGAKRERARRRIHQYFFVGDYRSKAGAPRPLNHTIKAEFVPLNNTILSTLTLLADREVAAKFAEQYVRQGDFAPSVRAARVFVASEVDPEELPVTDEHRLDSRPYGPALVDSEEAAERAVNTILRRLRTDKEASVSIDLEGHQLGAGGQVSLVQLAIDEGLDGEPQLVYVFDVPKTRAVIFANGTQSLCNMLKDPERVKVLHCLHGDAMALFKGYGVAVEGVFDTGVADSLALSRHSGANRGLGTVLTDWLGDEVVKLTYKGGFTHEPGIWDRRPLTQRMFVYAYEDVTYCNRLYRRLRTELQQQGLLDLTFLLSHQRAPPYTLPNTHSAFIPQSRVAVALCDQQGRVLCLRDGARKLSLPSKAIVGVQSALEHKAAARALWLEQVGFAETATRVAINARLRKAVRIGEYAVHTAIVPDLAKALPEMLALFRKHNPGSTQELVLKQRFSSTDPGSGVVDEQRCVFQNISAELARAHEPEVRAPRLFEVSQGRVYAHIDSHVEMTRGRLTVRLVSVLRADPDVVETMSAVAKAEGANELKEPTRTAVILHDGMHAFVLKTAKQAPAFPQHLIEDPLRVEDSAALAFDTYAGVSLRKFPGVHSQGELLLMPSTSARVRAAQAASKTLGKFGGILYYEWRWPTGRPLIDYISSFYASRNAVNGFQMVASKQSQYPTFALMPVDQVRLLLEQGGASTKADLNAFSTINPKGTPSPQHSEVAALTCAAYRVVWEAQQWDHPQHSDAAAAVAVATTGESDEPTGSGSTTATATVVPATGPTRSNEATEATALPAWGTDPDFDALFTAAVAVNAYLTAKRESVAFVGKHKAKDKQPELSRALLLEEQRSHPGTNQYLERLGGGGAVTQDTEFEGYCSQMRLAEDGLLLWRKPAGVEGLKDRIVVPPRAQLRVMELYHDAHGHYGINKVLPLICSRFYWGTHDEMRKSLSDYISTCEVCSRTKIPHHSTGEAHLVENGDHPYDVIAGDVFDVGIVFDEYSHTLDFVCYFTRNISATAVKGTPTSAEIARVLLDVIIRNHGTPREIRSDRGTNFISKAIAELYRRLRIKITAGSAYSHNLVAVVERWHQTLKQLIRSQRAANLDDNWPSRLALLEFSYNSTVNASTKYSPFFLNHLRHPVLPWDALTGDLSRTEIESLPDWVVHTLQSYEVTYDAVTKSLQTNALHNKRRYDLRHDSRLVYRPGDRVLLIRGEVLDKSPMPKADLPTDGPFTVAKALPFGRYVLKDLHNRRIHNVVPVKRLIPCPERPDFEANDWMLNDPVTGGRWPVQRVVGRREATDGCVEYKLRWLGFAKTYDRWLPRQYLDNIAQLLTHYDESATPLLLPAPELAPRAIDKAIPAAPTPVRPHFRYHPPIAPVQPVLEPVVLAEGTAPPTATKDDPGVSTVKDELADRFPIHTRVDVHFPLDKQWWTGTVVDSYVTRPRKQGVKRARHIVVQYDDSRYQHETFMHDLAESEVRVSSRPRESAGRGPADTEDRRARAHRRAQRLAQQFDTAHVS